GLALSFVPKQLAIGDRFSVGEALRIPISMRRFVPDELRSSYRAWLVRTFGAMARKAGLSPKDSDSLGVETVRNELIFAVAEVGRDSTLTTEAVKLVDHWRDLPQSIRTDVLALAAHASPVVFDRLYQELFSETDRGRRGDLLGALATTRDRKQQT